MKLQAVHRGDPRTIFVTITDPDGDPIDLSGSTWTCVVRKFQTATDGIPLTVDPTNLALGVVKLTLSGEQSQLLGRQLVGDLEGTAFGTVLSFSGVVYPDVTRTNPAPVGGLIDTFTLTWGGLEPSAVSEAVRAILIPQGSVGVDHVQTVEASTWIIVHGLGHFPNVAVMTDGGVEYIAQVINIDVNTVHVIHNTPCTGKVRLS